MSQDAFILANGEIIDPEAGKTSKGSILIENGTISEIDYSNELKREGVEVIDCKGHWIAPGLVDIHVHLREPGYEWKETVRSGVEAAALGGYSAVCCMPNTLPAIDHAEVAAFIIEQSNAVNLSEVLRIGAVTVERAGKELAPLYELRKAGCVAFSDDGDPVYDSGIMRRALEIAKDLDVPICCHEEDFALSCRGAMDECGRSYALGVRGWPAVAEEVMIARDIELARITGGSVHLCHVTTARGALLVSRAKEDGIPVTAEVTPHHLIFDHSMVDGVDTNFKMSPPLRSKSDVLALREALASGVIDCVASDHAPHEPDSKEVEFEAAPMGILGLQTNLPLMLRFVRDGLLTKERAFDSLSTAGSRIFRLPERGLQPGARADFVVIDPEQEWEFSPEINRSKSENSPFFGEQFKGAVTMTVIAGKRATYESIVDQELKEAV